MSTPNVTTGLSFGASQAGANKALQQLNQSAENISSDNASLDLTSEIASQIESKHTFSANIGVIKVKDENLGTLIDLIG